MKNFEQTAQVLPQTEHYTLENALGTKLSGLVGNEPFKNAIKSLAGHTRMTHSFLLSGSAGTGVGYAARLLAADILYPNGGEQAEALVRGQCCIATSGGAGDKIGKIETGIVREAIAVRSEGAIDTIKVSQIRAVRAEVFHSGLSAEGRVVIIYGAEKMQTQAANALLKILEEPPEGVTFILTTASRAAVLPTIRSRTAHFVIAPPSIEQATEFCIKQGVAKDEAQHLAKVFGGRIGTILAVAKNKKRKNTLELAQNIAVAISELNTYEVAKLLVTFEKDKQGARAFFADFIAFISAGIEHENICNLQKPKIIKVIRAAQDADLALNSNVNTKAVLTNFAIESVSS